MPHANAIFLSLVSGAALVLGLAPGCSNNNAASAEVALVWTVTPGTNSSSQCGAVNDTFSIGDPEGDPIVTASDGTKFNNVPVSVNCKVSPNSTGYSVEATASYGNVGSITITGQFNVASGASPGTQSNITGSFNDAVPGGLIAHLTESDCTVTFSKNSHMGIAPTRVWGYIDCPHDTASNGTVCDANAEFLFENCGQ